MRAIHDSSTSGVLFLIVFYWRKLLVTLEYLFLSWYESQCQAIATSVIKQHHVTKKWSMKIKLGRVDLSRGSSVVFLGTFVLGPFFRSKKMVITQHLSEAGYLARLRRWKMPVTHAMQSPGHATRMCFNLGIIECKSLSFLMRMKGAQTCILSDQHLIKSGFAK